MKTVSFVIPVAPVTKKNSLRILLNRATGKPFVSQSEAYLAYERAAGATLPAEVRGLNIRTPVNVQMRFYLKTRRRVDLSNLQAALLDVLTKYAVLADDCADVVRAHDGSRVFFDKDRPRTEVTISDVS